MATVDLPIRKNHSPLLLLEQDSTILGLLVFQRSLRVVAQLAIWRAEISLSGLEPLKKKKETLLVAFESILTQSFGLCQERDWFYALRVLVKANRKGVAKL